MGLTRSSGIDFTVKYSSDHAWFWADFREDLCGINFRKYQTFVSHINTDDTRQAQIYNDKPLTFIRAAGIFYKLPTLSEIPLGRLSVQHQDEYDALLKSCTRIRKSVAIIGEINLKENRDGLKKQKKEPVLKGPNSNSKISKKDHTIL